MLFSIEDLEDATALVRRHMPETGCYRWPLLCEQAGGDFLVKHENHTPTGAFKFRSNLVYAHRLKAQNPSVRHVVSATRGNHGQGVAIGAGMAGFQSTVVVPKGNSAEKNEAIRSFGAHLMIQGDDFDAAKAFARNLSTDQGYWMIPSFHANLALGAATYAYELFQENRDLKRVYVPIGLGSGICGLITTRDLLGLNTDIIGVVSENFPCYQLGYYQNQTSITDPSYSIADGMAVRQVDEQALEIIQKGASDIVTVSDEEITAAVRQYYKATHNLAEGAGAASLAAYQKWDRKTDQAALILTGGNIDLDWFIKAVQ